MYQSNSRRSSPIDAYSEKDHRLRKGPAFTASVLFLAMFVTVLLSAHAYSQCPQWDVRRFLSINQSNNIAVKIDTIIQRGPRFSGTVSFRNKAGLQKGILTGGMKGDDFRAEIKWDYGETGVYTAKRVVEKAPVGTLSWLVGEAYIKEQPDNKSRRTTWRSSNPLNCYQDR